MSQLHNKEIRSFGDLNKENFDQGVIPNHDGFAKFYETETIPLLEETVDLDAEMKCGEVCPRAQKEYLHNATRATV